MLISFIAFILSCVGVDMARSNKRSIDQMKSDLGTLKKQIASLEQQSSSTYDCSKGDIIWGQTPVEGSVAWYQLIGGSKATLTWFEVKQWNCSPWSLAQDSADCIIHTTFLPLWILKGSSRCGSAVLQWSPRLTCMDWKSRRRRFSSGADAK